MAVNSQTDEDRSIYNEARDAFDAYAGLDTPELPANPLSALQVRLARWQVENFGVQATERPVRGVTEETGELTEAILHLMVSVGKLNHVSLKHDQKIRGYDDVEKFRAHAADAIADIRVYLTQICTTLRIDDGVNFKLTAEKVLRRNWNKDRKAGGT